MTTEQIARIFNAKRAGKDKWMAKCRAHKDRCASLKITRWNRSTGVHCHAGCRTDEVLAAVGLKLSDLFEDSTMSPETKQRVADQERLKKLEYRHGWIIMGKILNPDKPWYWLSAESEIEQDIYRLRGKLGAVR